MTNADQPKSSSLRPRVRKNSPKIIAKANIHLWDELIGAVMEYENGRIEFSYNEDYPLKNRLAISPKLLRLKSRR